MNILIIGASGLVGGNIYNYLSGATNWNLTGTYNRYPVNPFIFLDASKPDNWPDTVLKSTWDIIIHTGALTQVDKCEEEPALSEVLTVQSAVNICALAAEKGARLIYISTDYIFDGMTGPYTENDRPNPLCVYGRHKLAAENLIRSNLTEHLILRITNVYGDELRGKNFLSRIITQIKTGNDFTVTAPSDQYATPVNALDIAKAVLLLISDFKTGTYHIASTDFLNRVQFLHRVNSYFDDKLFIKPVKTYLLKQAAKRPLMGGLLAEKFLSEYPDFKFSNIDDYLKKYK